MGENDRQEEENDRQEEENDRQEEENDKEEGQWRKYIPSQYRNSRGQQEEDGQQQYVPKQYRKEEEHRDSTNSDTRVDHHTEASHSKVTAFWGVPDASDPLSKAPLGCLSVAGLAIGMVAAVRANRRTVNPHTGM